jgi:hypothetical protein
MHTSVCLIPLSVSYLCLSHTSVCHIPLSVTYLCLSHTSVCRIPLSVSGNAVEDMHAYRQYHGLDKAMGYLLQCLIVEEPGDPVQGLIAKMEEMPKLAKLRKELPDKPYWGNMKTSA